MDSSTIELARLSGFFAAHAVWCVSEGEALTPMLGLRSADGTRSLQRIVADTLEASVDVARGWIADNRMGAHQAVLVYDGYMQIDIGRTDALFVEGRDYATGEQLSVALPYRNAADPAGFAVYRPKWIADPESFDASGVGGAFFTGVADHERGAEVWNAHIDERH